MKTLLSVLLIISVMSINAQLLTATDIANIQTATQTVLSTANANGSMYVPARSEMTPEQYIKYISVIRQVSVPIAKELILASDMNMPFTPDFGSGWVYFSIQGINFSFHTETAHLYYNNNGRMKRIRNSFDSWSYSLSGQTIYDVMYSDNPAFIKIFSRRTKQIYLINTRI